MNKIKYYLIGNSPKAVFRKITFFLLNIVKLKRFPFYLFMLFIILYRVVIPNFLARTKDSIDYIDIPEVTLENTQNIVSSETSTIENNREIIYTIDVINSMNAEEFKKIKGIGDVTAKAIIEFRESIGGFKYFKQLLEVKGIGNSKYMSILNHFGINIEEVQ